MKRSAKSIKKDFIGLINSITPDDVARSPGDFTRRRLCPLNDTLMVLLSMEGHSLNTEIGNYFSTVGRQPPTKSAFSQQRSKLAKDALPNLLAATNRLFPFEKTFMGLHLLAVDGTALNIPPLPGDTKTYFPNSNHYAKRGFYQDHLTALYDLLEDRYLDAINVPRRDYGESRDFNLMVDRNPLDQESCLYIADRGFCCYNTLAHIIHANQYFLIRAKSPENTGSCLKGVPFPNTDEFDIDHTFILTRKYVRADQDHSVYKRLHNDRPFELLPFEDRINNYEIHLRIVRVLLSDDTTEYLLTNLPRSKFSTSAIKQLYRARWGIETSFRKLKYNLALVFFHSIKREFIDQEVFARLIMYNLISLLIGSVTVVPKKTKYVYKISFSDAVSHCRRFLLTHMTAVKLKNLLLMSLSPVRPGRSSPRKVQHQSSRTLNNRF